MKRNLIIINAALLAVVSLLGWYLHQKWVDAREREAKIASQKLAPVPVPAPPPLKKVAPIEAPSYADVAVKNLFSKDRNAVPVPDPPPPPPPPKPMPPLPVARGVMLWDGQPPTVVLSTAGNTDQKGYHPGDTIGDFKIVSVNNKEIVFEWDGKQIRKRLDEIMEKNLVATADTAPATAPAASQAPKSQSLTNGSSNSGPGVDMGGGYHACAPGDTSPPGTVSNGLKKVVSQTPFSTVCRWEPMK